MEKFRPDVAFRHNLSFDHSVDKLLKDLGPHIKARKYLYQGKAHHVSFDYSHSSESLFVGIYIDANQNLEDAIETYFMLLGYLTGSPHLI